MNSQTLQQIPPDVAAQFGPDDVTIDERIPTGTVRVYGEAGARDLPVNAFVKARRRARKAERQNRRRGRR